MSSAPDEGDPIVSAFTPMARQRTEELQGLRDMIRQLQTQVSAMEDQHMEMDMENADLRKKLQEAATTTAKTKKPKTTKSTTASPPNSGKFSVNDDGDYLDNDTANPHNNSDDNYLCDDDDISSALWAETHPVLAMERYFSA